MKIGIALKVDVTKLDKARFFKGKKGIYADLTMFLDTEDTSQYGDHGTITQAVSQEERKDGVKLPIIGNAKIFYTDDGQDQANHNNQRDKDQPLLDDEVPF